MILVDLMVVAQVDKRALGHITHADKLIVVIKEEDSIIDEMPVMPKSPAMPAISPQSGEPVAPVTVIVPFQVMTVAHGLVAVVPPERQLAFGLIIMMVSVLPIAVIVVVPVILPVYECLRSPT